MSDIKDFLKNDLADGPLKMKIDSFIESIISSGPKPFLSKVLDGLSTIESSFTYLNEKESRGAILGLSESEDFRNLLKLQRDFLIMEHETLSSILHDLTKLQKINYIEDFSTIISHIKKIESYDTVLIHYVPVIESLSLMLDPFLCPNPYSVSITDIFTISRQFEQDWKLAYWKGLCQYIFFTHAIGFVKSVDYGDNPSIDSKGDFSDHIRTAIDNGAIELLLFIASDINHACTTFEPFYDIRTELRYYVPTYNSIGEPKPWFLDIIYPTLEKICEASINHLHHIFNEMKSNEEDIYRTQSTLTSYDDQAPISGMDLERFFIFVTCLYYNRPDAALPFWADTEGELYGFVLWASHCEVVFMSAAFCTMLAALASGPECAQAVNKFLLVGTSSTTLAFKSKKVEKVSWNLIHQAISRTISNLKPPQPPPSSLLLSKAKVIADIPKLDTSNVILLTSYVHILSQVVKYSPTARDFLFNTTFQVLKQSHEEPKNIQKIHPLALALRDNQSEPTNNIPVGRPQSIFTTLLDFLSFYTPLYGPILYTFAGFARSSKREINDHIWTALDQWLFNTTIAFPQNEYLSPNTPPKDRISKLIDKYSTVLGLVSLLQSLIDRPSEDDSGLYSLPFPENIGGKYRVPGVWPYVEFVINGVFYVAVNKLNMGKPFYYLIQQPALQFMLNCLKRFDPEIPIISASTGIDTDAIVKTSSYNDYVLAHPSSIAMSFLFSSDIYNSLIKVASVDYDTIQNLPESHPEVSILINSLKIINDILNLQNIFIDIIKATGISNNVNPIQLSTHGLTSFEDAILYNLSLIPKLALYVSSPNTTLARISLRLLDRLSHSSQFTAPSYSTVDSRIRGNRMLSILETVDESVKIKEGFVEQLDRLEDSYEIPEDAEPNLGMIIKEEILQFLYMNMSKNSREASASHLLLGFKIESDGSLSLDTARGGILSEISLLQTILRISRESLQAMTGSYIPYEPSNICCLCFKIIEILIKNPISSYLILGYLREQDYFLSQLKEEPVVDLQALWEEVPFIDEPFFYTSPACKSMIAFMDKRASLLECLSVEIHSVAISGSLSLASKYIETLVNMDLQGINSFGTSDATRILSFLDVLEFNVPSKSPIDEEIITNFGEQLVSYYLRHESELDDNCAIADLRFLLKLKGLEFVKSNNIQSINDPDFQRASEYVVEQFSRNRLLERLRQTQLSCLRSWSKLLLVIVNDADMTPSDRTNLLLESFQAVLHKLSVYSVNDAEYAETIASLLVSLYSIYLDDVKAIESKSNNGGSMGLTRVSPFVSTALTIKKGSADRTYNLFKAVVSSILTPISTPTLRSELYVIAYKYLKNALSDPTLTKDSQLIKRSIQVIRSSGDKLIELIATDALNGEGTTRLTAYILLEVFATLSIRADSTFLLDTLIKYNFLLLIVETISYSDSEIVRQNTDSQSSGPTLSRKYGSTSGVTSSTRRYYELTIFKVTLSLLIQLVRVPKGARYIAQCGLFEILKTCKFLRIDPDVGIDIRPAFRSKALDPADNAHKQFGADIKSRHFSSVLLRNNHSHDHHLGNGPLLYSHARSTETTSSASPSDPQTTFYDLVGPTFQLITAIMLTSGSANENILSKVKSFLQSHELLVVALLRKDTFSETHENSTSSAGDTFSFGTNQSSTKLGSNTSLKSGLASVVNGEDAAQIVKSKKISSIIKHIVLLVSLTGYINSSS